MSFYDVIIVGAGPAGAAAAKSAAKNGAKVLLIEKHPTIQANKPCGEAVSARTFETAGIPIKDEFIVNVAYAQVYSPSLKRIDIKEKGFLINKSRFIQELVVHAVENGAEVKVREEVKEAGFDVNDKLVKVKTVHGEYKCKVLIGADGYASVVARSFGINEKSEPIPTVQYIMVGKKFRDIDAVRFYVANKWAPKGYAWIFPKNEKMAEVGVGVRGGPAKLFLDKFIQDFKEELGGAQIIDYRGAPVPIGGMINNDVSDGFILIGDAAGTVMPLTGGGIHSCVASGMIAGEVAAKAALEGNNSKERLMGYRRRYDEYWGDRIKKSLKAMRVLERLSDEELDELADILVDSDILDLANGLDIKRVALKLLSHPRLAISVAKALLS
ncbi:MAG: NAD(P)/FAD-dependent oxidoreductase [Thermoproteota archaeon]|jgi:digeranylgeranylglycerophospholipid reductase|nr:NAD(P)/FAD-dependent oxidoreductase [Thermoproteota archaeon]